MKLLDTDYAAVHNLKTHRQYRILNGSHRLFFTKVVVPGDTPQYLIQIVSRLPGTDLTLPKQAPFIRIAQRAGGTDSVTKFVFGFDGCCPIVHAKQQTEYRKYVF